MKIICVMIDTLRFDYLKQGGADRPYAPELDRFARDAAFFDQHYLSSFPTVPNREDIMTGKYSFPHHGWGPLPDDATPAAEIFHDAGYLTQLITDTPHLLGSGHRYHRGFDAYHWIRGNECDSYLLRTNHEVPTMMPFEKTRQDAIVFDHPLSDLQLWINPDINWEERFFVSKTARTVSRWIEDNYKARDFFLWIDTFEIHEPWIPPVYLQERYDPKHPSGLSPEAGLMCYPNYGPSKVYTKAELRNMRALYAGEVSLTSKWVGHILRKLEDVGIYDDCLIAIMADHGTYLGEHGRTGKFLLGGQGNKTILPWPQYDEVNRIPLMLKLPGQRRGRRVSALAQPVDYLPTLLDLTGIKTGLEFDGHSMRPLLEGKRVAWPRSQAPSSNSIRDHYPNFWTTLSTPRWLLNVGGGAKEAPMLCDKRTDAPQTHDVARRHPQVVRRMLREYQRFLERTGASEGKRALAQEKLALV